jgi:hypothetical protein
MSSAMYIFRAYKIQSFVLIVSIAIFYVYLLIIDRQNTLAGHRSFGSPAFFAVAYFVLFELIILPISTLYLMLLKKIKCNQIKICSNKSIAVFALCFELVFLLNGYISNYIKSVCTMFLLDYLIVSIGIIVLNIIFRLNKKDI